MFVNRSKGLGRTDPYSIEIAGEPASKANSRRLVSIRGKPAFIKSEKACAYSDGFRTQCRILDPMFIGDLHVDMDIWYSSRRSDLDESLILDLMQGRVYLNDRQVKSRRVRWGLDQWKPRSLITVRLAEPQDFAGC